jgi:hypothetical protein
LYNKKKVVEEKKNTIRPASPRRYPNKAASPSRLNLEKVSTPRVETPPRKEVVKEEKRKVEEVCKPVKKEEPVEEAPKSNGERGLPPPLPPPPAIKVPSILNMKPKKKK